MLTGENCYELQISGHFAPINTVSEIIFDISQQTFRSLRFIYVWSLWSQLVQFMTACLKNYREEYYHCGVMRSLEDFFYVSTGMCKEEA